MTQSTVSSVSRVRSIVLIIGAGVVMLAAGCRGSSQGAAAPAAAVPATTWAVVNGKTITQEDVDRTYRRTRNAGPPSPTEEELTAKLNLLNDLVVQELLLAKAGALKLEVSQSELDTAYDNAKKNIPDEAFQQELTARNVTAADMREGMRRELLTQKVIQQEVAGKITVADQEVTDFFNANRGQFNIPEEAYHIAQIVVTPIRDQQLSNASGDDATTPEAAVAKVRMLMDRLKSGASFADLAAGYSEDPDSAPRGGDLGFVPVSRLKQTPPPLRDAVLNKAPGSVNVANVNGVFTLVLVVARETAGQRDLSTPGVRDQITSALRGRKEQLLRTAYLTALRDDATVVNYIAKRLVESNGKLPTLQPSAPGAPPK